MRRTLEKNYPVFDNPEFQVNTPAVSWCNADNIAVPKRFGQVQYKGHVPSGSENMIVFNCDVGMHDSNQQMTQEAWFVYDKPVYINHPNQIAGHQHDGNVDFYIQGPIILADGAVLTDPHTNRGVRFPYKMATYFPIRNILVMKGIVDGEPTDSLKEFLQWVLDKIETISYKYNHKGEALLIGCDPEFMLLDMLDERINANTFFEQGCVPRVGCDGHSETGELRPYPADCPLKLTENIRDLLVQVGEKIGAGCKVTTGGGGSIDPLGHHIHFNKMISEEELELMDLFVGKPSLNIKGAKRPHGNYERLGHHALRPQPHGCEYRAPASSLTPELAAALHVTAYCVVAKWESLAEGDTFDIEVDDNTEIPTLESYLALDVTEDKRHSPHLKEYWQWVTRKRGKVIDPYKDILHLWVEGRKEVKPEPGIKLSWTSKIFDETTDNFVAIESLDKIHTISIFTLPEEEDEQKIIQVCVPEDTKSAINMQKLARIKTKYGIDRMLGFDHTNIRLGFTKSLIQHLEEYSEFKKMIVEIAKEICV